jgi:hypothetical protein
MATLEVGGNYQSGTFIVKGLGSNPKRNIIMQ